MSAPSSGLPTSVLVRRACAAALFAIAALQLFWHGWLFPPAVLPLTIVLSLAVGPLLIAGLLGLQNGGRGLLVGGIFCLFYLSHGVMEAWAAPAERPLALTEAVLAFAVLMGLGVAALAAKRERQ